MVSSITSPTTLSTAIFNQTSNNITTTQSTTQSDGTCELETKTYIVLLGYVLIFFIGVTGNGLVLFSFRNFWRRGPVIELLILYLAFFNFLSSMLDPMMFGYWLVTCYKSWHFGWYGCKFVSPLCRIFTNISIGLILIMAVDRCRAIVFPFRKKLTRGQVHLLAAGVILLGFASEVHHVFGSFINDKGLCDVVLVRTPSYLYPSLITISGRILVIIFVFITTTLLAHIKLNRSQHRRFLARSCSNPHGMTQRCRKVTLMLVVMSSVFSITVLPRDFFHLIYNASWGLGTGDGIILS